MKHLFDQPEEPVIVDVFRQRREKDLVVQRPEAVGNVSLDEPGCPGPGVRHFAERSVAAPAGAETVGKVGEPRLIVRLQQEADHLAHQLI